MKFLYVFSILLALCACEERSAHNVNNANVVDGDVNALTDADDVNQCIDKIENLSHLQKAYDNNSGEMKYVIIIPGYGVLTYEQALQISTNWDYNDLKFYTNQDQELQEHEKDACEVLERLTTFIETNNVSTNSESRW